MFGVSVKQIAVGLVLGIVAMILVKKVAPLNKIVNG